MKRLSALLYLEIVSGENNRASMLHCICLDICETVYAVSLCDTINGLIRRNTCTCRINGCKIKARKFNDMLSYLLEGAT